MNRDSDMLKRAERSRYAHELLSARSWFERANELTATMSLLEPHVNAWWESMRAWSKDRSEPQEYSFAGPYMMLAGYAIENLCKGYFVDGLTGAEQIERMELECRVAAGEIDQAEVVNACSKLTFAEQQVAKEKGKLPPRLSRHTLAEYVSATGYPITAPDEEELLHRLHRAVVWFGRYPVSKRYNEGKVARLSDGKRYSTSWLGGNDTERIKELIRSLREHVGAPESYRVTDDRAA